MSGSSGTSVAVVQADAEALTLDQFTAPAADLSFGGHKGTNQAKGSAGTDSAVFGQLALPPDQMGANVDLTGIGNTAQAFAAINVPVFYPIMPRVGVAQYPLTALGTRIRTAVASQTIGFAVYSVIWSGASTFAATLVCQLNSATALSTATATSVVGAVTTGANNSGANTANLDFSANRYYIGSMASTTSASVGGVALATAGFNLQGIIQWTTTARASTIDWPASFTQASAGAPSGTSIAPYAGLYTAIGQFFW